MPDVPTPNASLNRGTTLRQSASVLACHVGSELVLLDSAAGRYFGIDEIGARIFELVGAGRTLGAIYEDLIDTYDAPPETLWADLLQFSGRMQALGLFVDQSA